MPLKKTETTNIMIIGLGNHARRIYVPTVKKFEKDYPIRLVVGVELDSSRDSVNNYLQEHSWELEMKYFSKFDTDAESLPLEIEKELDRIVKGNGISGVIISTEPLVHKVYAEWAIKNGLNILMDKPISLRRDMVSDVRSARGLVSDYRKLLKEYNKLQKKKETIFSINVQRRYEPGFQKVFDLIRETRERFNIPVTSIQAQHADGVWIFPQEIIEQECHPYNQGYGKCAHSGYHIFDMVWQLFKSGLVATKQPECGEAIASFVQPDGLLMQLNEADYIRIFGTDYQPMSPSKAAEVEEIFKGYGENDAFCLVKLMRAGVNICNISINLLHNSFSRRSAAKPAKDLYKGNGRTKAQSYFIQQGPFQCIQIHNYQSNDKHDYNTEEDYNVGGNNYFEIYVFRNAAMYGPEEKPFQVYNIRALTKDQDIDSTRLYYEIIKERVILEFIQFMLGIVDKKDLKSNIDSHENSVKIMSAVYESNIRQKQKKGHGAKFSLK